MKKFSIIAALDERHGIGKENRLPWHIPLDIARFKEISSYTKKDFHENVVIMGRLTWASIPFDFRPLSQRKNIVVSRRESLDLPNTSLHARSLESALEISAHVANIDNVFLIGGAQLYEEGLHHPLCQRLYITRVQGNFDCDRAFPHFDIDYALHSRSEEMESDGIYFHFEVYNRLP